MKVEEIKRFEKYDDEYYVEFTAQNEENAIYHGTLFEASSRNWKFRLISKTIYKNEQDEYGLQLVAYRDLDEKARMTKEVLNHKKIRLRLTV